MECVKAACPRNLGPSNVLSYLDPSSVVRSRDSSSFCGVVFIEVLSQRIQPSSDSKAMLWEVDVDVMVK